jgi:hypothetical protein
VTRPGIDPGTVRLVAQRLNHYATPGPYIYSSLILSWRHVSFLANRLQANTKHIYMVHNVRIH